MKAKDTIALVLGYFECLFLVGQVYGWASLNYVLKKDGVFGYLCSDDTLDWVSDGNETSTFPSLCKLWILIYIRTIITICYLGESLLYQLEMEVVASLICSVYCSELSYYVIVLNRIVQVLCKLHAVCMSVFAYCILLLIINCI